MLSIVRKGFEILPFVRFSKEMEALFRKEQQQRFLTFFRAAVVLGLLAYCLSIVWDWFSAPNIFLELLTPRLAMQGLFVLALLCSFHKRFDRIAHYVGMAFFLIFMANVIWLQALMEKNLEEGYGFLITPDVNASIIVFSGAEIGYGALLTPLLLLPIAFSGGQSLIVSLLTIITINIGMHETDLPSAFVETANSIFISIGFFSTILAFLVNQHRRAAFKLNHELREANDAKSEFLAMMSHEVRTPLVGMLSMTSALEKAPLDQHYRECVKTVKYSGETVLAMLNDILDFSKMEAGKFEIEAVNIDLIQLTNSVVNLMQSRSEEKGLEIRTVISDDVPEWICSDPTRLRQVLLNLISNAIKFTETGHITVALHRVEKQGNAMTLRVEVRDTGPGMTQDVMDKLFQEFAQADASTSRKYGGTGLGLSICKKIIELLDGDIQVTSEIGQGSCFWFEIPVERVQKPVQVTQARVVTAVPIKPLNILLVEDDKVIAKFTTDMLERQNHTVTVAYSGQEAIDVVQSQHFDMVFMDYNLTDMKGSEITSTIREMGYVTDDIPVIGLTANIHKTIIDECFEAGMVNYIVKPIDRRKLEEVLTQYGTPIEVHSEDTAEIAPQNRAIADMIDDFGEEYAQNMVQEFIDGIDDKITQLQAAVENDMPQAILQNAHDVVSMSGAIGLMQSSHLFRQIELNAHKKDGDDIANMLQEAKATYQTEKSSIDDNWSVE